jgi:hypothetical protein
LGEKFLEDQHEIDDKVKLKGMDHVGIDNSTGQTVTNAVDIGLLDGKKWA